MKSRSIKMKHNTSEVTIMFTKAEIEICDVDLVDIIVTSDIPIGGGTDWENYTGEENGN